jgi:hypothetical protein
VALLVVKEIVTEDLEVVGDILSGPTDEVQIVANREGPDLSCELQEIVQAITR